MKEVIHILLVDDHQIVRLGLMTLLNDQPDMHVVGEVGNAADAVNAVESLHPDVVLMDIRLPRESGIEATRQITNRFPETKVVMLTSFTNDSLIVQAISAGAVGYVLKQVGNDELLRGIKAAAKGQALFDPATTSRLISHVRQVERDSADDAFRDLSPREMDVLAEIARGKTNAEIGLTLNLKEKTVRNYVSKILEKLVLTNRIELAIFAVQNNIYDHMDSTHYTESP